MSAWDTICEPFIEERLDDLEEFDYFEFADLFEDKEQASVNLYYIKILDSIIKHKSELANHCRALKKEFTKRNNRRSSFGESYWDYWDSHNQAAQEARMNKRARDLEEDAQKKVFRKVLKSLDTSEQVKQKEKSTKQLSELVREVLSITKSVPSCPLSDISVLDLTNQHISTIIKEKITLEQLTSLNKKIKLKAWIPDDYSHIMLNRIKSCPPSYPSLRKLLRKSVVPEDVFDAMIHHNILTIEAILTNFLNILEFNGPLITDEYYERTSAISLVTPIMSALFMKSRSLATKWFEIQTKLTNRHLFDVVIFYEGMDEPLALGEFAGPTQGNEKTEYDTVKVYRNGMRIINEVAHKTKNGKIPRVFIVLFQKAKLHFETLSLIDNCTYVRARYATLKAPSTPEELIKVFMNISKVISWRDALVESTTAIRTNDDSACSSQDPDCTLDTSSVSSSQ